MILNTFKMETLANLSSLQASGLIEKYFTLWIHIGTSGKGIILLLIRVDKQWESEHIYLLEDYHGSIFVCFWDVTSLTSLVSE